MTLAEVDDLPEINAATYAKIDRWCDVIDKTPKIDKRNIFAAAVEDIWPDAHRETDLGAVESIKDDLFVLGRDHAGLDDQDIDFIIVGATVRLRTAKLLNGHQARQLSTDGQLDAPADQAPLPAGPENYGVTIAEPAKPFAPPPLSIDHWLLRDLPAPDFILGDWLSTTTRGLLVAPTGLGKTNFAMALGVHASAGVDFLHWRGRRPCTVLYIDGEMSRRLLRQRLADATARLGSTPAGFHVLSAEDVEGFAPLNTPGGQSYIDQVIAHIGKPDLVIFDSIMCLTVGDMKDGEAWSAAMPWVRSLTRQCIGQIWVHHTGHDESRSYGDKTKEWQLDTVMHMEPIARDDTDVSFSLEFRKARERTPNTRADFQTARVALVADQWTVEATGVIRPGHVSPLGLKFLDALSNALAGDGAVQHQGRRAAPLELWKAECFAIGLLERDAPAKCRALWSKYRHELIAANRIACDERFTWVLT
jgi:hypothetical protein